MRRVAQLIVGEGNLLRKIEFLGTTSLAYRMKAHATRDRYEYRGR